ncbi:MAG: hypothetical protein V1784_12610, partial [bacterium]
ASWADLEYEFEMASGQELGPFFQQWLFRSDAPKLHLGQLKATKNGAHYQIEVEVLQPTEPPYELEFPVKVYCEGGVEVEQPIRISTGRVLSTMIAQARPMHVALDPDAHAFRLLWPDEQPATIAGIIGARSRLFVLPGDGEAQTHRHEEQLLRTLMAEWNGELAHGLAWQDTAASDIAVILPWRFGRLLEAAWPNFGEKVAQSSGNPSLAQTLLSSSNVSFDATILAGKDEKGRLLLLINAAEPEVLDALGRKLPHYGKYSYLGFREGKCTTKGIWQPISPLTIREVTIP